MFYKIPPPTIKRNAATRMTIPFRIRPPVFLLKIPIIKPIMAKGKTIQFTIPNKGISPISIPISAIMPIILLIIFIS